MKRAGNSSGQALLIAVLLLLILFIAIPAILFLNNAESQHGVTSQKRLKGRAIAEEGLAFAVQQLTSPPANTLIPWTCPAGLNFDGTTPFKSSQGTAIFTILCEPAVPLNYQVTLVARPIDAVSNKVITGAAVQAAVSQKTLAVKLPTGLTASAALELLTVPTVGAGFLHVYFGPVVNHDSTNPWALDAGMIANHWPRLFGANGISAFNLSGTPPLTDQKEYWTYTDVGFASVINLPTYLTKSLNTGAVPQPTTSGGVPIPPGNATNLCGVATPACGYFDVSAIPGGAYFGDDGSQTPPPYNFASAGGVIYVQGGDAHFGHVNINLLNGLLNAGAIIVDGGNVYLDYNTDPDNSGPYAVSYPPTALLDDPYSACACTVGSTQHFVEIHSFLYATQNMTLQNPGGTAFPAYHWWTLEGAVRVDGTLSLTQGDLLIYYNDIVNHSVLTTNYELQIDTFTSTNAS